MSDEQHKIEDIEDIEKYEKMITNFFLNIGTIPAGSHTGNYKKWIRGYAESFQRDISRYGAMTEKEKNLSKGRLLLNHRIFMATIFDLYKKREPRYFDMLLPDADGGKVWLLPDFIYSEVWIIEKYAEKNRMDTDVIHYHTGKHMTIKYSDNA